MAVNSKMLPKPLKEKCEMSVRSVFKPVIAVAAIAGSLAMASAAQAGPKFDVYVGLPGWGYYDEPVHYVDPGYGYDYDEEDYGYHHSRLSCYDAKQRVRWAGFRKVKPVDCDGRRYRFHAKKHGQWFSVTINAHRGQIVGVRELH
jgi:hypothetical protein